MGYLPIKRFTILGERCSGTNFLENAILENFDLEITWDYGWKHFFGFSNFINSEATLFIGIIRDPISWLDSFYKSRHHLPKNNLIKIPELFFLEHYSEKIDGKEILEDRNYLTKERYKNIFELRNLKNNYLINLMPTKVDNYILINYEDLRDNYSQTLLKIQQKFNLVGKNEHFKSIDHYKKEKNIKFSPKPIKLAPTDISLIKKNLNKKQEKKLGYLKTKKPFRKVLTSFVFKPRILTLFFRPSTE